MLLVSSHILDCNEIDIPDYAVIRVNLAWIDSFEKAVQKIGDIKHHILLDNPVDRIKPPSNKYSISGIVQLIYKFQHIKYFAVSNVESGNDLLSYNYNIPSDIDIIPKIETIKGIINIHDIALCTRGLYIMLDHDDLCADLIRHDIDPSLMYTHYINPLIDFCKKNSMKLLRTQGVIFSVEY